MEEEPAAAVQMIPSETTSLLSNRRSPKEPGEVPAGVQEEEPSFRNKRRRNRGLKPYMFLTAAAVLVLLAVSTATLSMIPTEQEADLLQANNLSWLSLGRLRRAQVLANSVKIPLNMDFVKDIQKGDVTKKDSKKREHFVEPPQGCEATVLIVRHCEKGHIREHCALVGYERSVYLATLFGDDKQSRWPAPSFVFAQSPGDRHNDKKLNFREIETVGPLAEKVGVEIDDSYAPGTANHLTRKILTFIETGQLCGKLAVISWKHSDIGHLARHLGCGPEQGCPLDYHGKLFDETWQIKFVYDEFQHSSRKNLQLPSKPEWRVYGSVQPEHFDPLAFSKSVGDYPPGGTSKGERWKQTVVSIPERKKVSDHKSWQHHVPGLLGISEVSELPDSATTATEQKNNKGK